MKRRTILTVGFALATAPLTFAKRPTSQQRRLGLTIASYGSHWGRRTSKTPVPGWRNALGVLDHCGMLGAGCLQISVRGWSRDFAGKVREKREALGIVLEGQIGLPKKARDLDRFTAEVRAAREAGATVLRCVCLGGRRYETFGSLETWKRFVVDSRAALERAEPVLTKHGLKLGIENHKDWRTEEFLELLTGLESEALGVTFDFGNNLSLLEDPHALCEALAPYILSTHVKDMGVAPHEDGFLLSEVPLGQGVLDLKRLIAICEKTNPRVQFNLEMITRDPLVIPVLSEKYWATMPAVPGADLARTLRLVRDHPPKKPLPQIKGKSAEERLAFEEANVRESFAYANTHLAL